MSRKAKVPEQRAIIGTTTAVMEPPRHRRLTMAELLKGSPAIKKLTAETAWAREGYAVGNEIG